MNLRLGATLLLAVVIAPSGLAIAGSSTARTLYTRALERERELRDAAHQPTLSGLRRAVNAYDAIVRRFPGSGYSDNALWQGGNLAVLAYERFGEAADKRTAVRLLTQLRDQYPASSLVARVSETLGQLDAVQSAAAARPLPAAPAMEAAPAPPPAPTVTSGSGATADASSVAPPAPVMIREIKRSPLPDGLRVTIEMDGESAFRAERLDAPRRVFFDLKGARPVPALQDATLKFGDDVVREVRLGRHPRNTTRIVFDMEGADSYSVFTLYNPFRLVIDFKARTAASAGSPVNAVSGSGAGSAAPVSAVGLVASLPALPLTPPAPAKRNADPAPPAADVAAKPLAARAVSSSSPIPPAVPAANSDGKFSLARQLGLGVSRIVIDAGHGGHDPGAQGNGISEAELVLDVATRLGRLLEKQPGVEVVMTRDTDVFVPLEERTAIANREGADLFLSVHANASRNPRANGIETYFLNFASNPEAEAVAARENSASARAMHSLPDIVRAIALNNKIDESRDLADMVQRAMVRRLSSRNKQLRDLGVKQAPFVVLIGAAMPSVLAEISFVTNRQEGQLLKTGAYRQQIAEALLDAVLRYQQSLKKLKPGVMGIGAR
jgi:N-acetylmuramoyl-L-alanine amidase